MFKGKNIDALVIKKDGDKVICEVIKKPPTTLVIKGCDSVSDVLWMLGKPVKPYISALEFAAETIAGEDGICPAMECGWGCSDCPESACPPDIRIGEKKAVRCWIACFMEGGARKAGEDG